MKPGYIYLYCAVSKLREICISSKSLKFSLVLGSWHLVYYRDLLFGDISSDWANINWVNGI